MKNKNFKINERIFLLFFIFIAMLSIKSFAVEVTSETEIIDEINASENSLEIVLQNDLYLTRTIEIPEGKNITLDLNGKAITVYKNDTTGRSLYAIDNYGTCTIKDSAGNGSITARGIENLGNGVMIIESGKIVSSDSNGGAAIWNESDLTINSGTFQTVYIGTPNDFAGPGCINNSGKCVINGGTFSSVNRRTYAVISTGNIEINNEPTISGTHGGLAIDAGEATINGGKFISTEYYGLYVSNDGSTGVDPAKAKVIVNNGDFTGKSFSVWIGSDVNNPVNSTIQINGGNFNNPLNVQNNVEASAGIKVYGGTFSSETVSKYVAENYSVYYSNLKYIVDKVGTISANQNQIFVKLGETKELGLNVTEGLEKYITITNTNPNVVEIAESSINGLVIGNSTITANLNNGSDPIEINVIVYNIETQNPNNVEDVFANKQVIELVSNILSENPIEGIDETTVNNIKTAILENKLITTDVAKEIINEDSIMEVVNEIKSNVGENYKIAEYYNVEVLLKANETVLGKITLLKDEIPITISIPNDLEELKPGDSRSFKVIGIHDGNYQELETVDNGNNTITFKTNKFSIYALAYTDIEYNENIEDTNNVNSEVEKTSNPTTGDIIMIFVIILIISAAGVIIINEIKNSKK